MNIHETAIINKDAKLEDGVCVGPYAVIDANTRIGAGTSIGPHCVVGEFTTIGKNCQVFSILFSKYQAVPIVLVIVGPWNLE